MEDAGFFRQDLILTVPAVFCNRAASEGFLTKPGCVDNVDIPRRQHRQGCRMNGTIRSPSSSEASAAPGCSSFFTGPVCLYGPADLERDFSISKRAAEARAGQGRARDGEEDNEMERLVTQTTISSAYSADAPPSPVSTRTAGTLQRLLHTGPTP